MLKRKNKGISGGQIILTVLITILTTAAVEGATGTVNYNIVYQQLEGFGGAAVYDCPSLINHTKKEEIYGLLFKDLGIEILRIRNTYGYLSDPTGSNMAATKIIIAEAREPNRSPNLKIELVPWSPPGNLKSTGKENNGTSRPATLAKSGGQFVYDAYSQWWYDSLVNWASGGNGIVPDFISLQNEPDWETDYDSCKFTPSETSTYAGYDKAFQAVYNKIDGNVSPMPKMWAPCTMGFGNSQAYIDALNAIGQMSHIDGFSHHLYSDGSYDSPDGMITGMQNYKTNYGDYYGKPLNMTEYVKNGVVPNFDMAWKFAWHIYNCLYYEHVKSYFNWTLFRGWSSGSAGGGIVTMDSSSTYIIRPQYWYLKAYAHFTGKDWYVLNTSVAGTTSLRMSAFKDPDGDQLTVVILNTSGSSISFTSLTLNGFTPCSSEVYQSYENNYWVDLGEFSGSLTLPAYSITTIHMTRALKSDINCDCYVNYEDLGIIADNWLRTNCTAPDNCEGADFEPTDGVVDLLDFSRFAEQWLWCNDPENPSCDNW